MSRIPVINEISFPATRAFWRSFEKLSDEQQRRARHAFIIFKQNPFDPRLRFHKIQKLSARYARAIYGKTAGERGAFAIGEKAGEETPAGAKLPTDADLNMMAQKYFKQHGPASSRVGTWPSRTVTRTDSRRRTTSSDPLNGTLLATD